MEWMDGGEWGFFAMTKQNAIRAPSRFGIEFGDVGGRLNEANGRKEGLKQAAVDGHVAFWNQQSPGQVFEHWRFGVGWDGGFEDAVAFFGARAGGLVGGGARRGGDGIGVVEGWVRKRLGESGQQGGFVWEWEQGFRRGIKDAGEVLGV